MKENSELALSREDSFKDYVSSSALVQLSKENIQVDPFHHWVVDDFFKPDVAAQLESEFLPFEDSRWHQYDNAIELKKTLNNWNIFPALTYRVFSALVAPVFLDFLSDIVGKKLYFDPGLHGGGWHLHGNGGNLNPHQDYSIHPKRLLQRKLNLIVYLSKDLKEEHGGHLGLWRDQEGGLGDLVKEVQPKFNRAVLFDTTQKSWHGMSRLLNVPEGFIAKVWLHTIYVFPVKMLQIIAVHCLHLEHINSLMHMF